MCAEKGSRRRRFTSLRMRPSTETLLEMWDKNAPIDFITLDAAPPRSGAARLRAEARLSSRSLFTFLPTAANAAYYIEILQEKFTLREIINVCTEFAARGYDEQDDVPSFSTRWRQRSSRSPRTASRTGSVDMKEQVMEAIGAIQELY